MEPRRLVYPSAVPACEEGGESHGDPAPPCLSQPGHQPAWESLLDFGIAQEAAFAEDELALEFAFFAGMDTDGWGEPP